MQNLETQQSKKLPSVKNSKFLLTELLLCSVIQKCYCPEARMEEIIFFTEIKGRCTHILFRKWMNKQQTLSSTGAGAPEKRTDGASADHGMHSRAHVSWRRQVRLVWWYAGCPWTCALRSVNQTHHHHLTRSRPETKTYFNSRVIDLPLSCAHCEPLHLVLPPSLIMALFHLVSMPW